MSDSAPSRQYRRRASRQPPVPAAASGITKPKSKKSTKAEENEFMQKIVAETTRSENCINLWKAVGNDLCDDCASVNKGLPSENGSEDDVHLTGCSHKPCSICLAVIDSASVPIVLSCNHIFCEPCIDGWFAKPQSKMHCPICRVAVVESQCRKLAFDKTELVALEKTFSPQEQSQQSEESYASDFSSALNFIDFMAQAFGQGFVRGFSPLASTGLPPYTASRPHAQAHQFDILSLPSPGMRLIQNTNLMVSIPLSIDEPTLEVIRLRPIPNSRRRGQAPEPEHAG